MKLLKDLAFLGYITIVGLSVVALVMLVVPIIECLVRGTPFWS